MNVPLVMRMLGNVCMLIGASMIFSLPWAHPQLGVRNNAGNVDPPPFEFKGFFALTTSMILAIAIGLLLRWLGRNKRGRLFRKEAMAVVGLSWVLATILGALPYFLAECRRGPCIRLAKDESLRANLLVKSPMGWKWWHTTSPLSDVEYSAVGLVLQKGYRGMSTQRLDEQVPSGSEALRRLITSQPLWNQVLEISPSSVNVENSTCRVQFANASFMDVLFESQSGFSTTGATVFAELEDTACIPHCILFWRSSTHFLGGLGIIVLLVVILGQGSAGKALMLAELAGPAQVSSQARMQHVAWSFAGIYAGLNVLLTFALMSCGMTLFDALCHAFGAMATGGFSTYNASIGHFDSPVVDTIVWVFMILAGTNFTLIFLTLRGNLKSIVADVEWRTYVSMIFTVSAFVVVLGMYFGDFDTWRNAVRFGVFQATSIVTTTGYGTRDFDAWNNFSRAILFLMLFSGACAGSTSGGLKIIRHIVLVKLLRLELERSYHPNVVRPLRIGGRAVEDPHLARNTLVYFSLFIIVFVIAWILIILVEPDATWGSSAPGKMIDTASAVAACMSNVGPGLGTVGASQNYSHLGPITKFILMWLMVLGRVEIMVILCLFSKRFWSSG